jgi:hypothetical protein
LEKQAEDRQAAAETTEQPMPEQQAKQSRPDEASQKAPAKPPEKKPPWE